MRSKDRKLRVIFAITCLNSSIGYLESAGLDGAPDYKADYERMKKFRRILADEHLELSN